MAFCRLICFWIHSGYFERKSFGRYGVMSSRLLVIVKLGMYWNSIWTTSGRPLPDFSTVRTLR